MNANRLRRQLRLAGWEGHARNLGSFLLRHGPRCDREYAGVRLAFDVDRNGQLIARLSTGELVATEDEWHVHKDSAPVKAQPKRGAQVVVRMPERLDRRLRKAARAQGRPVSDLVRFALAAYLDSRGL